jgi:hypothetical protein
MGKIPLAFLLALAVYLGVTLVREGPDRAFGGLFGLLTSDSYGESDTGTRSGAIADEIAPAPAPPEDDGEPWWSRP